jgi:hypothetical protein
MGGVPGPTFPARSTGGRYPFFESGDLPPAGWAGGPQPHVSRPINGWEVPIFRIIPNRLPFSEFNVFYLFVKSLCSRGTAHCRPPGRRCSPAESLRPGSPAAGPGKGAQKESKRLECPRPSIISGLLFPTSSHRLIFQGQLETSRAMREQTGCHRLSSRKQERKEGTRTAIVSSFFNIPDKIHWRRHGELIR